MVPKAQSHIWEPYLLFPPQALLTMRAVFPFLFFPAVE